MAVLLLAIILFSALSGVGVRIWLLFWASRKFGIVISGSEYVNEMLKGKYKQLKIRRSKMGAIAWGALAVVMLAIWIIVNLSTYLMPTWLWIILTPAVTSCGALVIILVAEGYHRVKKWILWADVYLH